ncbi:PREDICTED: DETOXIFICATION [Prunus dulcis]|uniref:Protein DETOXIFICATION n=1 Tax=Prunus dulcis TaxID=3755 RepID=A0A5E4FSF2_PRUDU|nr:protein DETOXIFICATION 46, chloroplastic [Prunus dulcis]XP_034227689.1 protein DETOXIFICATION 46, chloroplastic [Prunus dulcis]XP_034227690.1 protein DETOXIFICATION 46, chloroplastic [Prunus dulcis]VVA30428.1 PREDICTED: DETOXIFICATION [Prunus dulcis]
MPTPSRLFKLSSFLFLSREEIFLPNFPAKQTEKMQAKTLIAHPPHSCLLQIPTHSSRSKPSLFFSNPSLSFTSRITHTLRLPKLLFSAPVRRRNGFATGCVSENLDDSAGNRSIEDGEDDASVSGEVVEVKKEELENPSLWNQMKEIAMFTGPATGLWICGPLMSLIDTVVIGQGSSIELAALGPGTVMCDYMSYVFMFLSIATSNMVATSLARQDKNEVQHQISNLLFVGLTCGFLMLLFTRFFGSWALTAFSGSKNVELISAANTYVQIRGLAWPALLVGWVTQSASLGMKDSWGPLKALAVASAINAVGDVLLCSFLGYGIAGAAWATMVSQVVAGYMMIEALNNKGYNGYAISVPSSKEFLTVLGLAAPVFVTMMSKVAFYSLLVYFATSMGTNTMAAHQVMIQTFCMCTVWGEPLSQTAQSFMPEFIYGVNRSLAKARMLLKSLVIIGAVLGSVLGIIGTCVPWLFPNIFTPDQKIIQEMHKVLIPYFLALAVTPPTHSLEGTLLAGRDLKFISLSMSGCFSLGGLLLLLLSSRGYGLAGCWWALVAFQWTRFFLSLQRLISPDGMLFSEDMSRYKLEKLRAV